MQVIKRNGKVEAFSFNKVQKVIDYAIQDPQLMEEFIDDLSLNLKNNITTSEIQGTLIKLASEKITIQAPQWQFVAAKLIAYDLYKQATISRKYKGFGYGDFGKLVRMLVTKDMYSELLIKGYSKEEIKELGEYIKPERDDMFTYSGLSLLKNRYLIKGFNKEVIELPQERFMVIAMYLGLAEKDPEMRIKFVKNEYDLLSQFKKMNATPTLLNAGTTRAQLSSCFILDTDDDLWSIKDVEAISAQLSKFAGGVGIYAGRIRGRNASIRNHKNASNGIINWLKGWENTAISCNQLGARAGAFNVSLDIWHSDVQDFIELRTEGGDERLKAHKLHHTINVPDLYMNILKERGTWYLFDPHEIEQVKGYRLEESFGKEFEERYIDCVNDENLKLKKPIEAIKLWTRFLQVAYQKGEPYVFFRDTAQSANPNKHEGFILATNLCTEIMQNIKYGKLHGSSIDWSTGMRQTKVQLGDNVVCNLASLHLGNIENEEELAETIYWTVRALDNVIDMNYYPVPDTEWTNKRYRAIGLGQMDYHHWLAKQGITWESEAHVEAADKLFENIAFYAIRASNMLSQEKGQYPLFHGSEWHTGEYFVRKGYVTRDEYGNIVPIEGKERWFNLCADVMQFGIRNGYLMATAPTGTISIIANATATTDPIFGKLFMEGKGDSAVPVIAPDIDKYMWFYKDAHLIDQKWSVRAMGARQKHIDQGASFNMYIRTGTSAKELYDIYMIAWESSLKSTYYMRTKTLTVEECLACQ